MKCFEERITPLHYLLFHILVCFQFAYLSALKPHKIKYIFYLNFQTFVQSPVL